MEEGRSKVRGVAKKAFIRLPLWAGITFVMFIITALIGGIVGYLTISKSQNNVNDITSQLRQSIMSRVTESLNRTLYEVEQVLVQKTSDTSLSTFVNGWSNGNASWMTPTGATVVSRHYQAVLPFPALENCGIAFQADANGNSSYMAAYPRGGQVYFQDATTGFKLEGASILGVKSDYSLTLSPNYTVIRTDWVPNVKFPALATNGIVPGTPFWSPPIFTPIFKTFLIPLFWPVWPGLPLGSVGTGSYSAAHFVMLSIKSLDNFLQTVQLTPNGVVSLIDGNTGLMMGSSIPNISQNGTLNQRFAAMSNPNALVAATATYIVNTFSTDGTFAGIPVAADGAAISATFNSGAIGDDVQINALWLSNPSRGLKWLVVLAVPSNDFLSEIKNTTKQAIIYVACFCVLALIIAVLLSFAITAPLRKLSAAMVNATKFDFGDLRDGYLDHRSGVTEIGDLQGVFNEMMIKFAEGIENNKKLTSSNQPKTTMAGTTSSSNQPGDW